MAAILAPVLPLFGLIAIGWLAGRAGLLGTHATDSLNRFVLFLALPAELFLGTEHLPPHDLALGRFVAAYGLGLFATFFLALLLARHARLADRSIEALGAAYPNAGYLGLPVCLAVFGRASLAPVILATLLTVCALFAACIALIEFDLAAGRAGALRRVARSLVLNPILIAPLAGMTLAATGLALPQTPGAVLRLLADSTTPCALVTIGLFLAEPAPPGTRFARAAFLRVVAIKLVAQPAITLALAFALRLSTLDIGIAVLLSAMPIGTGPFMLARLYAREPGPMSRAILVSTVLSLATLPAILAFVGRH